MFLRTIRKFLRKQQNKLVDQIDVQMKKSRVLSELVESNRSSIEPVIDQSQKGLTISLTTFGRRIHDVFLAIESIGRQTLRPGRIVLWLAQDEFDDKKLPITLKRLQDRGLTVCYSRNIKVYMKLLPSLSTWPDDCIVTIDDDIVYGFDLIEQLYSSYLEDSNVIYCGMAKHIKVLTNQLAPYNSWPQNSQESTSPSYLNYALGVGGVLYPPNCFHQDVTNEEKFMRLTPYADDTWYKIMSLLNNIKVKSVHDKLSAASNFIPVQIAQKYSLSMINVVGNKNDEQLENVFKEYDAMSLLDPG